VSIDLRIATGATRKIGVAQSGYRVWRDTFGIHFIESGLAISLLTSSPAQDTLHCKVSAK
jgi:hypothetical protein